MSSCLVAWLAVGAVPARADAGPPPLEDAVAEAARTGKPLIVEVLTTWCDECQVFDRDTLPDARVQAALANVVFVRYDADVGVGEDAARRLGVASYPTFIALDDRGVEQARHHGAFPGTGGPAKLVAWLADASAKAQRAAETARAEARRFERTKRQLVADRLELIRRFPRNTTRDDLALATLDSGLRVDEVRSLFSLVFLAVDDIDALRGAVYVALAAGATDEALVGATKLVGRRRDARNLDALAECHHVRGDRANALQLVDEALAAAKGSQAEPILTADRARFARGSGEGADVAHVRIRVAELWKRAGRSDAPPRPEPAAMRELRAYFEARAAAARLVATRCRRHVGPAQSATARLVLDSDGKIIATVIAVEPGAPEALRGCLAREVAATGLVIPDSLRSDATIELPLQP